MTGSIFRRLVAGGAVAGLVVATQLGGGLVPASHTIATGPMELAGGGPQGGPWYMEADSGDCSESNVGDSTPSHLNAPMLFEFAQLPAGTAGVSIVIGEANDLASPPGYVEQFPLTDGHLTVPATGWECRNLGSDGSGNAPLGDTSGTTLYWWIDAYDESFGDPIESITGSTQMSNVD